MMLIVMCLVRIELDARDAIWVISLTPTSSVLKTSIFAWMVVMDALIVDSNSSTTTATTTILSV